MTIVVLMQNFSSFRPFREKIGSNTQNSGRQLQQNEGRSRNSDKSLFIIGPKEAVSSSGLKKGAPQFQLGTIVHLSCLAQGKHKLQMSIKKIESEI